MTTFGMKAMTRDAVLETLTRSVEEIEEMAKVFDSQLKDPKVRKDARFWERHRQFEAQVAAMCQEMESTFKYCASRGAPYGNK